MSGALNKYNDIIKQYYNMSEQCLIWGREEQSIKKDKLF